MLHWLDRTVKRAARIVARARPLAPVVAWGLALWTAVVAVPFGFLYPDAGLDQPTCLLLALLAPAGLGIAALSGGAPAVLGAGLAGLLPPLVACPDLQGPRTAGPLQALLVALLTLGFVASAWAQASQRALPGASLRRLLVLPQRGEDRLIALLGGLWLVQAWWPRAGDGAESARAAGMAGVTLCWLAVRLRPLAGTTRRTDDGLGSERWPVLAGRRGAWLVLLAGLLWLWRNHV